MYNWASAIRAQGTVSSLGTGRVVKYLIGYFRVSYLLLHISRYVKYFQLFRVYNMLGVPKILGNKRSFGSPDTR